MEESPLYSRTYDLLRWLLPLVTKFPRAYRFNLNERIARRALDFHETLIAAGLHHEAERFRLLETADTQLNQLRHLLRLAMDLQLLSLGQYEHVSRMLTEIGRLLGAWIKKLGMSR